MVSVNPRRRTRLGALAACVLLLGLTVLLLANWLSGGRPTSARREVLTELAITWMFKQELLQGHLLSEWNPTWFSGFPWLRFLSYPVYYPVAAFSAWGHVPLERALVAFYFVVLAGSGLMMFAYLRRLLGDWRAALVGAVIYEAFPYHNHVGVETWIHAAFWALLPLPLWMIELSRESGPRRVSCLLLAGAALGCFPVVSSEYAMIGGPFVVLYLLLREASDVRHGRRNLGQALWGCLLVGVVALGIAAFFVLPAILEMRYVGIYAKHGTGLNITDEVLRQYSITPEVIWYAVAKRLGAIPKLNLLLPGLGGASDAALPWIARSFWSVAWYPGLVVPLLVLLGLTAVPFRSEARVALIGAALSLLFVSGPMFSLNFFSRLPVIGRLMPFRGLLLTVAFLAILAGFGVEWLLRHTKKGWLPWVLTGGIVLAVLGDFWPSRMAYQTTPEYFGSDERRAYGWLAGRTEPGRLWEVSSTPQDDYLRSYSLAEVSLPRHLGYYDNGAPLHTWEQATWTDARTVTRLHQVRYVMLRQGEPRAEELLPQLQAAGYSLAFAAGKVQVWENPAVAEYARLYGRAVLDVTQDFRHPFKALPGFVLRDIAMVTPDEPYLDDLAPAELKRYGYVLVDDPVTRDPQALAAIERSLGNKMITVDNLGAVAGGGRPEATIYNERLGYGDIYLEVSSAKGGLLTLAESWYPHWRVRVDGQWGKPLRVNWALLGVWLGPGEHRVEFHFERPGYVYAGYATTILTVLLLVLWWTWHLGEALRRPKPITVEDLEMPVAEAVGAPTSEDGRT